MSTPKITEPLRLAVGSHSAGSGKGCAMNVVSWENGDKEITDFPRCSDRLLAGLVQVVNDTVCTDRADGDRLLCPPCSVDVLALAHRTVGTACVATGPHWWLWTAEVLGNTEWGLARYSTCTSELVDFCRARSTDPGARLRSGVLGYLDGAAHQAGWHLTGPVSADWAAGRIGRQVMDTRKLRDRVATGHAMLDAWCSITGHAPSTPAQSTVDAAVARMREVVPAGDRDG